MECHIISYFPARITIMTYKSHYFYFYYDGNSYHTKLTKFPLFFFFQFSLLMLFTVSVSPLRKSQELPIPTLCKCAYDAVIPHNFYFVLIFVPFLTLKLNLRGIEASPFAHPAAKKKKSPKNTNTHFLFFWKKKPHLLFHMLVN